MPEVSPWLLPLLEELARCPDPEAKADENNGDILNNVATRDGANGAGESMLGLLVRTQAHTHDHKDACPSLYRFLFTY